MVPVASLIADARRAAKIAAMRSDFTKVANDAAIAVKRRHVAELVVGRKWPAMARSSRAATPATTAPAEAVLSCLAVVRAAARCSRAWA